MSKLIKKMVFCRKRKRNGIYTGNIGGKIIRLADRAVVSTADPDEIKFLMDDPEIEFFCANEEEQELEDARKKDQVKK